MAHLSNGKGFMILDEFHAPNKRHALKGNVSDFFSACPYTVRMCGGSKLPTSQAVSAQANSAFPFLMSDRLKIASFSFRTEFPVYSSAS